MPESFEVPEAALEAFNAELPDGPIPVVLKRGMNKGLSAALPAVEAQAKAPLEAEMKLLQQKLDDARYLGDNHHNAAACPHCRPEMEAERRRAQLEIERLREMLHTERGHDRADRERSEAKALALAELREGLDTLHRVNEEHYYGGESERKQQMSDALNELAAAFEEGE